MEKRITDLERRVDALEGINSGTPILPIPLNPLKPPRIIKVCAGIGDNIWLLQKLYKSGEKFLFKIAADNPRRGKQIFDLMPDIVAKSEYDGTFTSLGPIDEGVQHKTNRWADVKDEEIYLSANKHLEDGYRLEWFMPDLETTFRIPWKTEEYRYEAEQLLPGGGPYVGLYGSAYSTIRYWSFWEAPEWAKLAASLRPIGDPIFVIMGANFDTDLAKDLGTHLANLSIKQVSFIGKPLGLIIEIMKRLSYFFAFPSGLGILSTSVGCPTMMFYPEHLEKMINAWAEGEAIMSGQYLGVPFISPEEALQKALENGSLRERLNVSPVSS